MFKENTLFGDKMAALKAEAERLKAKVTAEQDRIKAEAMKLRDLKPGPERNKREADLEQQHTHLRTTTRQAESELLSQEARVYFDTYREMQAVVEAIAQANGLSLVLRFDSEDIDPNNQQSVKKGLNRSLVFHRKLDLTPLVSQQLNARMAAAPAKVR